MTTRSRTQALAVAAAAVVALAALAGPRSSAQFIAPGQAVTAEGDILRGQGFYLWGAGQYNLYTSMAESIHVDTWMRLNEYIYQSLKADNAEKAARRRARFEARVSNLKEVRDRIANDPNAGDIARGDAMNSTLRELLKYNPSSYRLDSIPLESEVVRKIPFLSAQYRAELSLMRVNPTERRWPIGMRRPEFEKEKRDYEKALDAVLDLQADGKTTRDAVLRLREAVRGLEERLPKIESFAQNKVLYTEAYNYIKRLRETAEAMQRSDIEQIYAALDQYSGRTVHDLVAFMQKWNLQFGVPDLGAELETYPLVRASLKDQLDDVRQNANNPGREPQAPDPPPPGN